LLYWPGWLATWPPPGLPAVAQQPGKLLHRPPPAPPSPATTLISPSAPSFPTCPSTPTRSTPAGAQNSDSTAVSLNGRIRTRAAGSNLWVNAQIMTRRSRPYRIGGAICPSRNLLYGRDGAGDTWPKRGAVVPRRLALLLRPLVTAVSPNGRVRARAAGSTALVNARIMARRSRPYLIGGAICPSRKLLYGRDGAGDTWPKRGAVVPRRLALLLRHLVTAVSSKRPCPGESGGREGISDWPGSWPAAPAPTGLAACPLRQPAVRAGRRGWVLAETWGRCAAPSRPLVTTPCYGRIPKRPYPGESGGKYGIGEGQDHGPPLSPLFQVSPCFAPLV
jgi:hypothetical protein